ncbi:hypothetical protein CRYUN_Cryun08bG0108700 [Craigia yunnanensis]
MSGVYESPAPAGEEDDGAGKRSGEEDWLVGEEEKEKEKDSGVFDLKEEGVRDFGETSFAPSNDGVGDGYLFSLIYLGGLTGRLYLFAGVDGLPPLSAIEDMRYEKNTRKSTRTEIERQKLEELAKARVRQVDDKGRAYGLGEENVV